MRIYLLARDHSGVLREMHVLEPDEVRRLQALEIDLRTRFGVLSIFGHSPREVMETVPSWFDGPATTKGS